jgi:hypothetical protein
MIGQRPMWYAQPRGTAITAVAALDGDDESPGFLGALGHRLTNLVDGGPAAVLGFLVVLSLMAGLPAAGAATSTTLAAAMTLVPVAWCILAAGAGVLVHARGDQAPDWASALVSFMSITGKIAAMVFVVMSIVIFVAVVVGLLTGVASMGRERW